MVVRGHTGGIEIPRFRNEHPRSLSPTTANAGTWSETPQRRHGRVAGLPTLLHAQRAARITQLTTKHVIISQNGVELSLAITPIWLPPMVGDLVLELLASSDVDPHLTTRPGSIPCHDSAGRSLHASCPAEMPALYSPNCSESASSRPAAGYTTPATPAYAAELTHRHRPSRWLLTR